jgi:hypothetical protein
MFVLQAIMEYRLSITPVFIIRFPLSPDYAQQQPLSTAVVAEKRSMKMEVDDGGCARTDVTRNSLLSNRAKERSKILKEKSHARDRDLHFVSGRRSSFFV